MRRTLLFGLGVVVLIVGWLAIWPLAFAQVPSPPRPRVVMGMDSAHLQDFNTVVKGAKEYDGLFKLYQKDDKVYMEILPHQFDKPVLCPIAVARGAGLGGYTLNFDEQWALLFKQVGNKVHLIRRNVHFKAKAGSPIAKAVETSYTDSVLMALPMITKSPRQGVLLNLNDIFMTDFAQLGIGHFDANRSTWHKIKAFPRNVELEVQATYSGGRRFFFDDGSTIDPRGNTVVIHYGLAQLPEGGYQPRLADDRVGFFLTAVKDFSSKSKDTSFVRYINRWKLEPAEPLDPKNPHKLSVPKKSINFYIEKTVPHEYRAAVQEGILEWNKAFEKIGYRNAIEAVQERDDEDWDPEDMNYNTFRWITTGYGFAMGPSRANPLTGEILDADILFDADLVRIWKQEQKIFSGTGVALSPISPIHAISRGWGLDHMLLRRQSAGDGGDEIPQKLAADRNEARLRAIRQGVCQCGSHMNYELGMAAMALAERNQAKPGEMVPDDLINQAIKYIVMHEVGHTLGLRHNFKASSMLPNEQLHDTQITHAKGLVGSVMDYVPVNLAPKGTKQGDYYTTTIGPYDYWAIEYAYKPFSGGTDGEFKELEKIANQGAAPGHDYGTDEDIFLTSDPLINPFDLGADVLRFAKDRVVLAEELLKGLSQRVVDKGEGYQRARLAFEILLSQYGDGAYLVSRYVGGEYANRDHRDDPKGRDPLVPVTTAKQREALKFLQEHIFSDKSFQFPPQLLRRLAVERWDHWGTWPGSTDFPLHERILGTQQLALDELLSSSVLRRIQNNALKVDKDEQPLTLAELFRSLTDSIWSELPTKAQKDGERTVRSSVVRRNLQREHIKKLSTLVLGQKRSNDWMTLIYFGGFDFSPPPDARSLSRMHLREISKRIQGTLNDKQATVDEATRAHLEECKERIAKVLSASMQVND
jgi:hypothetical protein